MKDGSNEQTSLIDLIKQNKIADLKERLQKGADVNQRTDNNTPLEIAINAHKIDFVNTLIAHGADINKGGKSGYTPIASAYGNYKFFGYGSDIVIALINAGADVYHYSGSSPDPLLCHAIKDGAEEIINTLLAKGVDVEVPNRHHDLPATLALEKKNVALAKKLIDLMKDLNVRAGLNNGTLLHKAIKENLPEIVALLLNRNVDIDMADKYGDMPIMIAFKNKQFDLVKKLLARTKDPNQILDKGNSLLILACQENRLGIIEALLARQVDVNYANQEGKTALHIACDVGQFDLVEKLLNAGASPHLKDKKGNLPIDFAKQKKYPDIVKRLETIVLTENDERQVRHYQVAREYQHILESMSKMIVLGLETKPAPTVPKTLEPTFSNFEGYATIHKAQWGIKGNPLKFDVNNKEYPVGYKIFIPPHLEKVGKVIINVYGGLTKKDLEDAINKANRATKIFYQEGSPVIELLLPDLLHNVYQSEMNESQQTIIHDGIHHFFTIMSKASDKIHPKLQEMGFSVAEYGLYGASFGGRTAIRHGQLHPHTYKWYMSHNGALGPMKDMPIASDDGRPYKFPDQVYPSFHIKDCEDLMLILQNRADNNVNILTALQFYQDLKSQGKSHLTRLCFFEAGNPVPKKKGLLNKGHFLPQDQDSYVGAVFAFMEKGIDTIPELQEHAFVVEQRLAKQYFRDEDDQDRFLALASKQFFKHTTHLQSFDQNKDWPLIWKQHYHPILIAIGEIKQFTLDNEYLKQYLEHLDKNNLLTDDVIKKAVKEHAAAFRELYKELNQFDELSEQEIIENPVILASFKAKLLHLPSYQNPHLKSFMLECLLFSNPSLLPALNRSKAWTPEAFNKIEKACYHAFEEKIRAHKSITKRAWVGVATKAKQKHDVLFAKLQADFKALDLTNNEALYQLLLHAQEVLLRSNPHVHNIKMSIMHQLADNTQKALSATLYQDEKLKTLAQKALANQSINVSNEELDNLNTYLKEPQNKAQLIPLLCLLACKIDTQANNLLMRVRLNDILGHAMQHKAMQKAIHQKTIEMIKEKYPKITNDSARKFMNIVNQGINVADNQTRITPLHKAIDEGNFELIQLLAENGADLSAADNDGQTILATAKKSGKQYIIDYIQKEIEAQSIGLRQKPTL